MKLFGRKIKIASRVIDGVTEYAPAETMIVFGLKFDLLLKTRHSELVEKDTERTLARVVMWRGGGVHSDHGTWFKDIKQVQLILDHYIEDLEREKKVARLKSIRKRSRISFDSYK